jgi:carbamoyl-phosphate synthase large subunit
VELGHKQPANLTVEQKNNIREIVSKIGKALNFENCPSHTELKINDRGIFVIETSPRLGGDYITSTITPLSTGINLEDQLLHIALGEKVDTHTGRIERASGVHFFCFPEGRVEKIDHATLEEAKHWPCIYSLELNLHEGDEVHQITSSLNRYGEFIIDSDDRNKLDVIMSEYEQCINRMIIVKI